MIYFIINNNYHYYDFDNHLSELNLNDDVALIEIPHTLDDRQQHDGIKVVHKYIYHFRSGIVPQIYNFLLLVRRVKREIVPNKDDVLFFYTEYEILNQYLAGRFKHVGARVFLLEDGGLGSYLPFRMLVSERLTLKEWLKQSIYRRLPGLSGIRFHKLNGHVYSWMPDKNIDGVCIYNPVALKRPIPTLLLRRPLQHELAWVAGRVMFLNEPLYNLYQSKERFLDGLEQILEALCGRFSEVLFKFHPRESAEWRDSIRQRLFLRFPDVKIIEENLAIEMTVGKYLPSVAASYYCAALLTLADRGIEPLYLYHLFEDLQRQKDFQETTSVLIEMGYNFVPSFSEIDPNFQSGLLKSEIYQEAITLSALVGQR